MCWSALYLSTGIEHLKLTRFMFLIERADDENGIYINCFRESVNFFIPDDKKKFLATLLLILFL